MNREEFVKNASEHEKKMLYKRFCKDNNLPIKLFEDPYFHSRMDLYEEFYDTYDRWNSLWDMLENFNNIQDYFEYYDNVKELAINSIKNTEAYNSFINYNNSEEGKFIADIKKEINQRNLYSDINHKKLFLSIDMKQANFHGMKLYDNDMFNKSNSWEDFIGQFSEYEYIKNSKYIRQVILGNCNPRRQVNYSTFIMCQLYNILKPLNLRCISIEADELIFDLDITDILEFDAPDHFFNNSVTNYYFSNIEKLIKDTLFNEQIPLHIELFRLYKIKGTSGYIKKYLTISKDSSFWKGFELQREDLELKCKDLGFKLKCFDSVELPFVLKALYDEPIEKEDMFFYSGDINKIAILCNPIDIKLPKDLLYIGTL